MGSTLGTVATDQARRVRVALVAGEASGDLLGAGLVAALRERLPGAEFAGIGGQAMRDAGLQAWHDCSELAVMGLAEVLRHLPRLLRLRRGLRARLSDWQPDVFVGIDAPDFNLGLERQLRQRGIPTVHYVSPSVWAWREGRAARIGESADRVLCLFPMEPPIYARHGVDARFVGHPLADAMPLEPDRAAARARFGLSMHDPVLAVLPGSAAATPGCRAMLERQLAASGLEGVRLLDGDARAAMEAADVVLLASGTAALEAMLAKRPMVIGHRIAPLTHALVRRLGLLKSRFVSLPNVLAGEALVPELLQDDCTPANLAAAVLHWFEQPEAAAALRPRFRALHESLRRDASASAADAVAGLLAARS